MKVIDAKYEILDRRGMNAAQKIEMAGRTAYKSEDKITDTSAYPFLNKMLVNKHMPVIEFSNLHVALECAMSQEEFDAKMAEFTSDGGLFHYIAVATNSEENSHLIVISGTVRAFLEMMHKGFESSEPKSLMHSLADVLGKCGPDFPIGFGIGDDNESLPIDVDERVTSGIILPETMMNMMRTVPDVLEQHMMCAVRFTCNRAVSHELVRHRPLSILQESQRYCRYSEDKFGNEVTFIKPKAFFDCPGDFPDHPLFDDKYTNYFLWYRACSIAEETYLMLLNKGNSPQAARTVLPNSCKTEVIMYATIAEWRHIENMRVSPAAEPSMRELTIPLFEEFFSEENKAKWE